MGDRGLERLAPFLLVGVLEDHAKIGAFGTAMRRFDLAGKGAIGGQGEFAFAHGTVGFGRQYRQFNHLAGSAGGEGPIAALQVRWQIADRRALVGGIEDEIALAVVRLHNRNQARIVHIRRQPRSR